MKAPSEAQTRRYLLLACGIALTVWETIVRHAAEPIVYIIMATWVGFKPTVNIDSLLRKPSPETPVAEATKEVAKV